MFYCTQDFIDTTKLADLNLSSFDTIELCREECNKLIVEYSSQSDGMEFESFYKMLEVRNDDILSSLSFFIAGIRQLLDALRDVCCIVYIAIPSCRCVTLSSTSITVEFLPRGHVS